jgi:hypothetical protein
LDFFARPFDYLLSVISGAGCELARQALTKLPKFAFLPEKIRADSNFTGS